MKIPGHLPGDFRVYIIFILFSRNINIQYWLMIQWIKREQNPMSSEEAERYRALLAKGSQIKMPISDLQDDICSFALSVIS